MKKIFLILFCCALMGAAVFWGLMRQSPAVSVLSPALGPAVQAVYATGTVEPGVMIDLAPRQGARLTALYFDEGAEVKKGDLLAQFEDTDLQKSADELTARMALAEKEFERKNRLRATGAIAQGALDTAKTNLEAARAALAQVMAQQDYLRIVAPENGRIIRRDGEVGEFIPTGQSVFSMECCAAMRITAEVDEEDIPLVRPGQSVLIRADAFPGRQFEGKIQSITPKGDAVARSYRVRIVLNGDSPLMTGMTAEANIMIRQVKNALLLPASAVSGDQVWFVRNGRAQRGPVTTGARGTHAVEIISGVRRDDVVIDTPAETLNEGQAVRPVMKDWKPEP